MTPTQIIYQRRVAVLADAQQSGNVAATCRRFGISRTRYYQWKNLADRGGLAALVPKERRHPQLPDATPIHVIEELLTLAVLEPTIGCRQYADRLGDRGFQIAKSTVQRHLVAHKLGTRAQRLARAAAIAVLSDNGPEYKASGFRAHLAAKGLTHQRIPARSPNHNAVCERFHGTILQECWRPAFHRRDFTTLRQLQTEADAWLHTYHHRRRNHSHYMRGHTPHQILDTYRRTHPA